MERTSRFPMIRGRLGLEGELYIGCFRGIGSRPACHHASMTYPLFSSSRARILLRNRISGSQSRCSRRKVQEHRISGLRRLPAQAFGSVPCCACRYRCQLTPPYIAKIRWTHRQDRRQLARPFWRCAPEPVQLMRDSPRIRLSHSFGIHLRDANLSRLCL